MPGWPWKKSPPGTDAGETGAGHLELARESLRELIDDICGRPVKIALFVAPELIPAVAVGNETLLAERHAWPVLRAAMQRVRAALPGVAVTTSEPFYYYLDDTPPDFIASQDFLLPRTLLGALQRFATTSSIPAVSGTIREQCEEESDRLDSELSMVRYIAWAIPSIGFIGTVRGIGDALGQAHRAVEGDITGVTASLGVAFNSTFIALVISIVLMFFIHQLQLMQERLVLDSERYVDHWLIRRLRS